MRSSEIAGLKVSDINLKSGRIDIRRKKGSNNGTDSLSAEEITTWGGT
jgi:integrase